MKNKISCPDCNKSFNSERALDPLIEERKQKWEINQEKPKPLLGVFKRI